MDLKYPAFYLPAFRFYEEFDSVMKSELQNLHSKQFYIKQFRVNPVL